MAYNRGQGGKPFHKSGDRSGGKPAGLKGSPEYKTLKTELKDIRNDMKRLMANEDEQSLPGMEGKSLTLTLKGGKTESGILKEENKFQIIITQNEKENHVFKSSILKVLFD